MAISNHWGSTYKTPSTLPGAQEAQTSQLSGYLLGWRWGNTHRAFTSDFVHSCLQFHPQSSRPRHAGWTSLFLHHHLTPSLSDSFFSFYPRRVSPPAHSHTASWAKAEPCPWQSLTYTYWDYHPPRSLQGPGTLAICCLK